jgi:hypothetical protein
MEHLKDPYLVLIKIVDFLASEGKYRFFCPNYDFPYEPHYSKWMFRRMNNAYFLSESRAATSNLNYQSNPGSALIRNGGIHTERLVAAKIYLIKDNLQKFCT